MNLFLSALTPADEREFIAFHKEFVAAGGRINPGILRRFGGDFKAYLDMIAREADAPPFPTAMWRATPVS